INFYLKNALSLSFLGTFAYQTTYDPEIDETYKYSSSYFELRIKKEFGFPQPRLKFYNLNVVFFKDLNGDRTKEDNEPGVKNVLVNFIRNENADLANDSYEYQGEFSNVELLSDQKGLVRYINLAQGIYNVEFHVLMNNNGSFTAETNNISIRVNKDKTVFVPFFENNKIFGKVVMNRSKLSNLGDIDISNLKITATDRDGRVTSTLTDKNGNFTLYVPDVDKYKVKINNIFYENFDLQQNNFEVQLNGYKQFELTFVFNEKRRRIRFSSEYEMDQSMQTMGLEIVRRTNLKGTVKDATTQVPIKAKVQIFDKDNNVISETNSDVINGLYNLSFLAGENYRIVASADDYWFFMDKLYERQITTFQNIQKDILLKKITVGSIIPLNKLLFDEGKAELMSEATAELDRLLEVLKYNPTVRISIHGHCDDLEVLDVGPQIAQERAKMVAKYLIANGYSRVEYMGHGNSKPVAPNDNAEDRQKNRRVEVVVKSK
ncbi:MAG: OmpA family protein, partial [Chlorobi bacterium]|nr:OmpA family protein [Chlorobiota bacterium]